MNSHQLNITHGGYMELLVLTGGLVVLTVIGHGVWVLAYANSTRHRIQTRLRDFTQR